MKLNHCLSAASSRSVSRQSTAGWKRQSGANSEPFGLTVWAIAELDVDGVPVHSERRLHHRFTQGRVWVDVPSELPRVAVEQLRERGLGDELGGARADDVRADERPALRVRDHLHEPGRLAVDDRAAKCGEGKLADLHLAARVARLLFGEADRRDLRV